MSVDTIPSRLLEQGRMHPAHPAYHVRRDGQWVPTNWRDYVGEVRQAGRALISLGVESEGTVCILGFNRPEWVIMDLAAMCIGGAPAGIYTTCSPQEVSYILDHSGASVALVENAEQWEKVKQVRADVPNLKYVVVMDGGDAIDDPMVLSWGAFLAKGQDTDDVAVDDRIAKLDPEKTATLIYTSGTTGPPKAVMLTHRNLSWTSKIAQGLVGMKTDDCTLSYLPLSHIAEQMFSIHGPITAGASIYFAESLDEVPNNVKEVQPTIFFGVPRIWEKFHAGVSGKISEAEGAKAKLLAWAMAIGHRVVAARNAGKEPTGLLALQYRLATKLIFSKLKPALGLGRARVCVSGAAPIAPEVLEFFAGLDLPIHEVYGQSEDSGPTTFNTPGRTRYGTVGPVIPGVDVRIADDGEICVRGPNVFAGYYKDKETTDDTLKNGWLHSGDLGEFDADGFLRITGRKKDIIITAGGKNITPKNIESSLKNIDVVGEAVLIGDRRKYLTAVISLDDEAIQKFAANIGADPASIHGNSELLAHIQKGVDGVNTAFARVEHVRKFCITPRPFSVEDGELTPTLKVKRKIVHEHFADLIEAMYAE